MAKFVVLPVRHLHEDKDIVAHINVDTIKSFYRSVKYPDLTILDFDGNLHATNYIYTSLPFAKLESLLTT